MTHKLIERIGALEKERDVLKRGPCCREPWCEGDCTCQICAPDLAIRDLESALATANAQVATLENEKTNRMVGMVRNSLLPAEATELIAKLTQERDTAIAQVATWTAQSEQLGKRVGELEGENQSLTRYAELCERDKVTLADMVARLKQPVTVLEWAAMGKSHWGAKEVNALLGMRELFVRLADKLEGEPRAIIEVMSCRLGYGQIAGYRNIVTQGEARAEERGK